MLKHNVVETDLVQRAYDDLKALFAEVPATSVVQITNESTTEHLFPDLMIGVTAFGKHQTLIIEAKKNGQPRFARNAILQLRDYASRIGGRAVPIFVAPYVSPEVRNLCKEQGIGYLDLEGNARIVLDKIFIERTVPTRPAADARHLKSLFKPKSAQVLRVLLRAPWSTWKVKDLAKAASVSLGHVSNIRTALLEREWAIETPEGVILTEPNILLDAWREDYQTPAGRKIAFYTSRHGKEVESASLNFRDENEMYHIARAAFSAAAWLAPYARVSTHHFFVDLIGLQFLEDRLELKRVAKGENVVVTLLTDQGPLLDTVETAPGIICTSPVQTYLDLSVLGERGREAADHLREVKLKWST